MTPQQQLIDALVDLVAIYSTTLMAKNKDPDADVWVNKAQAAIYRCRSEEEFIKTPESDPDDPVVGKCFRSWDAKHYWCDSYDKRIGYWMTELGNPENRRNVSERAIGQSYHLMFGVTFRKLPPSEGGYGEIGKRNGLKIR